MPLRSSKKTRTTYAGRVVYYRRKNFAGPSVARRFLRRVRGTSWDVVGENSIPFLIEYCYLLLDELILRVSELIRIDKTIREIGSIVRKGATEMMLFVSELAVDVIIAGWEKIKPKKPWDKGL